MEKYQEIERSIIKKYRKDIWSKFVKAVKEYELIKENDRVMVCISGGKDSFLLAKCIQELKRHSEILFDAYYVVMNPGYTEKNRDAILENARLLNIPIEKLSVTCFAGDEDCPRDTITAECWEKMGIPKERIYFYGKDDKML